MAVISQLQMFQICTVFVLFKFYTVHKTVQILHFKMSEAGKSKQIKGKDLSLADKILVIDEFETKTLQSAVWKKIWNIAITGVMNS